MDRCVRTDVTYLRIRFGSFFLKPDLQSRQDKKLDLGLCWDMVFLKSGTMGPPEGHLAVSMLTSVDLSIMDVK